MKPDSALPEQVLYQDAELLPGRRTRITGSEADHARRSLRLRSGDPLHLVNGRGRRYRGRVTDLGRQYVDVDIESEEILKPWPRRMIWLGAGVLRSTRMDTLVEKSSELGVARFVPLVLERSVAKPDSEGAKEDRWHRLAIESLKQSRRSVLMEVDEPRTLEAFLEAIPPGSAVWAADPEGLNPLSLDDEGVDRLALVVGPEGGLSARERALLASRGARFLALGSNRLRAETAAISLVTSALLLGKEFGPPPSS
ncbi:MAG TPA: RsmE family RNA methyltransferase [Candidatus Eisenbacteria bacterium]|nr:RsmE family RNA methyltransferase [Candidatus Eisenbacteria bacterium]